MLLLKGCSLHLCAFFVAAIKLVVFSASQGMSASENKGGARGKRHSVQERAVHSGEHGPKMLLVDKLL